MSAPKPLTGRCLCGAVTYSTSADPFAQAICHCTDCQRQSGSPYAAVVVVPQEGFEISGDTLTTYVTTGTDHGDDTRRNFCSACGSPLFSESAAAPGLVLLKAGSLDDSSWLEPTLEVWAGSSQPWAPEFSGTQRMDRGLG